jgi:IMP cyclohydrolase
MVNGDIAFSSFSNQHHVGSKVDSMMNKLSKKLREYITDSLQDDLEFADYEEDKNETRRLTKLEAEWLAWLDVEYGRKKEQGTA